MDDLHFDDVADMTQGERMFVTRMLNAAVTVLDAEAYRDDILHEFLYPGAWDADDDNPEVRSDYE